METCEQFNELIQSPWIKIHGVTRYPNKKNCDEKQAIPTLDRFRPEIKNYEFDVNCRKFNITLLIASLPVFLVSATNFLPAKRILGTFN